MKSKPLVISLDAVACTDAAKANTTAKKNNAAAAMAPIIVIALIIRFGVTSADLNLIPTVIIRFAQKTECGKRLLGTMFVESIEEDFYAPRVLLNFIEVLLIE